MKIVFLVRIQDGRTAKQRKFKYEDDLPYPAVPQVDNFVVLTGRNGPIQARRVAELQFRHDGAIVLDIKTDGIINDPQEQIDTLLNEGYTEV